MQSEKDLIKSLLVALFLVLAITYGVMRTDAITANQSTQAPLNQIKTQNQQTISNPETPNIQQQVQTIVPSRSITKINNATIGSEEAEPKTNQNASTGENKTIDEAPLETGNNQSEIITLPGTSLYVGGLASLQRLALNYEYILKDDKNIYYVYLGKQEQDFGTIARAYNGNIVEIVTDAELQKNQLFGDAITFLNIPQYRNNIVLMIVYINNDIRLVQIDYSIYHDSKSYLQQRFIY